MTPIEADHYREEVKRLKKDPIVIEMADELWNAPQEVKDKFWNHDAEPTAYMMGSVNARYRRRIKSRHYTDNHQSLGGVAKAITALHKERVENK
jgi:hypothetical protein